jgi:hypothetical protein
MEFRIAAAFATNLARPAAATAASSRIIAKAINQLDAESVKYF